MTLLAFVQGCTAQSHAVINGATIANFSCFTNHNAHAVVEENTFAQLGPRMNFDARHPARKVGNETSQPFEPSTPARMSPAVKHHRMQARIAREHLP